MLDWLETHLLAPAYKGWVLLGLAIFFFAAATNTLAGWLYVMSGVLFALLGVAAVLSPLNLKQITVQRQSLRPVMVGTSLLVYLNVTNQGRQPRFSLTVQDQIPPSLGSPRMTSIDSLLPGCTEVIPYEVVPQHRGVYHWETIYFRTAAPLGLFWSRRPHQVPATAVVYPLILPLSSCQFVESLGETPQEKWQSGETAQLATEGITRALRPYRWGDPTRLIHWRTSARYGELRVRELEKVTSGQQITIALNTRDTWELEAFEQAVIAAASLYSYADRQGVTAALWTPEGGTLYSRMSVLSSLAAVTMAPTAAPTQKTPVAPVLWLSMNPVEGIKGGQQICWGRSGTTGIGQVHWIDMDAPLQPQLQVRH